MIKRKRSRRRALLTAIAAALLLNGWLIWQQESIVTETCTVTDPRLPAAFEGFRIVHLSDLHGKEFGPDNTRLLAKVADLEPDLIALTGDFIDRAEQVQMLPALLDGLTAIAPTYFVTGNHDWASVDSMHEFRSSLEEHGATVLSGDYVTLEREGQSIVLAGLDDPNGLIGQTTGPQLRADIVAAEGLDAYSILLSHRDTPEEYAQWGFHLALCGHGHGGIFRIPLLNRGLLSTDRTLFPDFDGGLYTLGGNFCVVSRGLGSNTSPFQAFRLFNRPHLPLVILSRGT